MATLTPRPLPETRTAPTLPPPFTATFTPTITLTPTLTLTSTATATLTIGEVCEALTLPTTNLDGSMLQAGRSIFLGFSGGTRGGVITWTETHLDTGEEQSFSIPTGQDYLMAYGEHLTAGRYKVEVSITIGGYTNICAETVQFIVEGSTPTPENSLITDLLNVIIDHARRRAPTLTPEATAETTP